MTKEKQIEVLAHIIFTAAKSGYMPFNTDDETCAMKIAKNEIDKFIPSLPSNVDEAAKYAIPKEPAYFADELTNDGPKSEPAYSVEQIIEMFKAGAEWYDNQMKMPNSSELISAWRGVKSILQEKDFRGDEWRLAYNAFMFGFSKGLNTQTKKK